jgi:hypothetical protein
VIGILLGVLAAVKQNTWMDTIFCICERAGHFGAFFFYGYRAGLPVWFCADDYTGLHMTAVYLISIHSMEKPAAEKPNSSGHHTGHPPAGHHYTAYPKFHAGCA